MKKYYDVIIAQLAEGGVNKIPLTSVAASATTDRVL